MTVSYNFWYVFSKAFQGDPCKDQSLLEAVLNHNLRLPYTAVHREGQRIMGHKVGGLLMALWDTLISRPVQRCFILTRMVTNCPEIGLSKLQLTSPTNTLSIFLAINRWWQNLYSTAKPLTVSPSSGSKSLNSGCNAASIKPWLRFAAIGHCSSLRIPQTRPLNNDRKPLKQAFKKRVGESLQKGLFKKGKHDPFLTSIRALSIHCWKL